VADVDTAALDRMRGDAGVRAADVDVTDEAQVVDLMVGIEDLAVLVLSAAVEVRAPLTETGDDDWQRVIDVNLKGPFLCMKHGIPAMARRGGGSVIALGSTLGQLAAPGYPAYCASKTALVNLCKQAAIEHAADGVRVNVVAPSACEVGLFARVADGTGDPEGIRRMVASRTPMGRLGSVDDVCGTVRFLASPAAAYISGAVIPLDGGMAARRS
jgi:NAD(P)-dependent dehydrogenase (short-subunit alcohol dehydrogenase family)